MARREGESEWQTRKRRVDPRLEAMGWTVVPFDAASLATNREDAIEEFPTESGPADYRYDYERAVGEGFLVDYDVIKLSSNVRMNGLFLQEGEQVGNVDPETGAEQMDLLEDERQFDTSEIEQRVTAPESSRTTCCSWTKVARADGSLRS